MPKGIYNRTPEILAKLKETIAKMKASRKKRLSSGMKGKTHTEAIPQGRHSEIWKTKI